MNRPVEKTSLSRLLDPLFLLALALLLLNDHCWKGVFHNFFTGKLSDFTGVYAFAWVCLSLCGPRLGRMRGVHVGLLGVIGLAFALWKSPWSEPLLVGWNALDLLPLQRVVDYGDWAAIAVLPFASRRFLRDGAFNWGRLGRMQDWSIARMGFQMGILGLSIFAFCATSSVNWMDYQNVHYDLPLAPSRLVQLLNALNDSSGKLNPPLSPHYENANQITQENRDSLYHHNTADAGIHVDSIYDPNYFDGGNTPVLREKLPFIDSMYVGPDGKFSYRFPIRQPGEKLNRHDQCYNIMATLQLEKRGVHSRLHLVRVHFSNCKPIPLLEKDKSDMDYVQRRFEEVVIDYLKTH